MTAICSLLRFWLKHPLAKRDLWGTILRFVSWQVGVRVLKMPVIIPWVGGTCLAVEKGMNAATMNFYCGLFEPVDMVFILHVLRPGDIFFRCRGERWYIYNTGEWRL